MKRSVFFKTVPEEETRFRRCCPYCHKPVVWRYFGTARELEAVDLKSERPRCAVHGPLNLWVVIDFECEPSPAIVAIAAVDDPPPVVRDGKRLARVLPRFLREPILLADSRPLSARWKRTIATRLQARRQPLLLSIDRAQLTRAEWKRVA